MDGLRYLLVAIVALTLAISSVSGISLGYFAGLNAYAQEEGSVDDKDDSDVEDSDDAEAEDLEDAEDDDSDDADDNDSDDESVDDSDDAETKDVEEGEVNNSDEPASENSDAGDTGETGIMAVFSQIADAIVSFFQGFWV